MQQHKKNKFCSFLTRFFNLLKNRNFQDRVYAIKSVYAAADSTENKIIRNFIYVPLKIL